MNALDLSIQQATCRALLALFQVDFNEGDVQVQRTQKGFFGDRTVVIFPMTRIVKKAPPEIAKALGEYLLAKEEYISGFDVVKGFLNLEMSDAYWFEAATAALGNERFGLAPKGSESTLMVEYSSPNTNKPLHLGHLRNIFLGYSVAQILEAAGHDVVKVQIINDRGIHICKSMVAWKRYGNGETPESSGMKGDKLVGKYYVLFDQHQREEAKAGEALGLSSDEAKEKTSILKEAREMLQGWEAGVPEIVALWKEMNSWVYAGFETTYREMEVEFDKLYYESDTYLLGKDEVLQGLEQGAFYRREDGSVWIDLQPDGLDEKLILRKDGTSVYMTQDIGTAIQRFRDVPDLAGQIYTVGNEQEYHFRVLFLILEKLGFSKAGANHHLSYGMVELPEGKMKSREGRVVDADDLLREMADTARSMAEELGKIEGMAEAERTKLYKQVGYGALKYFLLKVSPQKPMLFDPKASIDFIGNTGPFIQFNFVRASSVLSKAGFGESDLRSSQFSKPPVLDKADRALLQTALTLPNTIRDAAKNHDPSLLASYAYDVMKGYSSWYQDHPILKEVDPDVKNWRLALSALCARNTERAMGLLGIQMPERM